MGKFEFLPTGIAGMTVVQPTVFGDHRGYFMETYHAEAFAQGGIDAVFVQDNQSASRKGVLRGLHFQTKNSQGKLVRVIRGSVYDVGVDLRPGSDTFGRWFGLVLSDENKKQLYIPEGFAHGFLVLSDEAEFVYKCTRFYDPSGEGGIRWDDPDLNIPWPLEEIGGAAGVLLSEKDAALPGLAAYAAERG